MKSQDIGRVCGVIALYWCVSISMIFLNKYLVGTPDTKVDLSLFVAWYQCVVASVVLWLVGTLGNRCSPHIVRPYFDTKILLHKEMLLMGLLFVGLLSFNNLCLKYVGIASYNIARSFAPLFTATLSVVLLRQSLGKGVLGACLLIVSGFILGQSQDHAVGSMSVIGVVSGLVSSSLMACTAILIKRVLPLVRESTLIFSFYNNLLGALLFIPLLTVTGQWQNVRLAPDTDTLRYWAVLTATGVFGISIGWVGSLQIKITSPVTHHVSTGARSVVVTVLGVIWATEVKTPLWWLSNALVVSGGFCYAMVRMQQQQQQGSTTAPPAGVKTAAENGVGVRDAEKGEAG